MRPLLTRVPLSHDRERKPAAQPKKRRKHVVPTTPALSFDPKCHYVPSGRQDPPVSPSIHSRPSTSESSTSSYDEQHTTLADREIHDQYCNGREAQRRPRIFPEHSSAEHSASFYPSTPYTDANDAGSVAPDLYDSPASYTSSSSPGPSEQSPCAAEFAVQVVDYPRPVQYAYHDDSQAYVQQPMVHQDPYVYPMGPCADRPAQDYAMPYSDATYGRQVPHGIPAYPENNTYAYPPRKY